MDDGALKLIKPEVLELEGYSVAVPTHAIKLNQNESPYELPDTIKEAFVDRVRSGKWSRYPSQVPRDLCERLRETLGLPTGIEVLVGNGSNELIQTLLTAAVERGTNVVIPVPTFALYRLIATVLGATVIEVPLKEDLTFDTRPHPRCGDAFKCKSSCSVSAQQPHRHCDPTSRGQATC